MQAPITLSETSKYFQQILENPKNYQTHYNLATLYYQKRQYQEAKSYFMECYINNFHQASTSSYLGNLAVYQQNWDEAIKWYEMSKSLNPSKEGPYLGLAFVYKKRGNLQKAVSCYTDCLKQSPSNCHAFTGLGGICFVKNDLVQAINYYKLSIEADKNYQPAYIGLGIVYRKQSKYKQASEEYLKCLNLNSNRRSNLTGKIGQNDSIQFLQQYQYESMGIRKLAQSCNSENELDIEMYILNKPKNQMSIDRSKDHNQKQLPKAKQRQVPIIRSMRTQVQTVQHQNQIPIIRASWDQMQVLEQAKSNDQINRPMKEKQQDLAQSDLKRQMEEMKKQFSSMFVSMMRTMKQASSSAVFSLQRQEKQQMKNSQRYNEQNFGLQLQARDRQIWVQIEGTLGKNHSEYKATLSSWLNKLVNKVVSCCFNSYLNNQMTFNQAKIYCCENIFKNIYRFFYGQIKNGNSPPSNIMNEVNTYLKHAFNYVKTKYPLNEEIQTPYKIQQFISQYKKDNTSSVEYDYFNNFTEEFQYRESGQYNDIIMRLINDLITTSTKNYYSFKKQMTKIFEGVFSFDLTKEQELLVQNPKSEHQGLKIKSTPSSYFNEQSIFLPKEPKKHDNHWKNSPIAIIHEQPVQIKNNDDKKDSGKLNRAMTSFQKEVEHSVEKNITASQSPQHHGDYHAQSQSYDKKKQELKEGKRSDRQKNKKQKQHRELVKSYTSYVIKRKIPEHVKTYTEEEIKNVNTLKIKDKSIFRILTKWCEELQEKFHSVGYYINEANLILLKDRTLYYLDSVKRFELNRLIEQQRVEVDKFIKRKLMQENKNMQFMLINRWIDKPFSELQNNCGIFANNVLQNLQYFTIAFLNRLIHGLLKVSRIFSKQYFDETHPELQLLTFSVKDLLRCRFRSKQDESQKMLKYMLEDSTSTLNVLRVKNRLSQSTNDILMNVYYNKMICEIQLDVQTKTTRFIECSNNFNHFLYEIERSQFGPITEMSNVWHSYDQRIKIYKSIEQKWLKQFKESIEQKRLKQFKEGKPTTCLHKQNQPMKKENSSPFICGSCNRIYYHFNYLIPHTICMNCSIVKCGNCYKNYKANIMKKLNVNRKSNLNQLFNHRYKNQKAPFPKKSICLLRQCQDVKIDNQYLLYEKNFKKYLMQIHKNYNSDFQFTFVEQLKQQKSYKQFLKKYIVYEVPHEYEHIIFKKQIQEILLKRYIEKVHKAEKDQIVLHYDSQNKQYNDIVLKHVRANKKWKIKKLIVEGNPKYEIHSETIQKLAQNFYHLSQLWISHNKLDKFPVLNKVNEITKISLNETGLQHIPTHYPFEHLQKLQYFVIIGSKLKELPKSLQNLVKLKHLTVSGSLLRQLPENIFHKTEFITHLDFSYNQLINLPHSLGKLSHLVYLNVQQNKFYQFPNIITHNTTLKYLNLSSNNIKIIPHTLQKLVNIEYLLLVYCHLINLQVDFTKLKKLKQLNLTQNHLNNCLRNLSVKDSLILSHTFNMLHRLATERIGFMFPDNCKSIFLQLIPFPDNYRLFLSRAQQITIRNCDLALFPDLRNCPNLLKLNVSDNKITHIGQQNFAGLTKIEELILDNNPLSLKKQQGFGQNYKIVKLSMSNCNLRSVHSLRNYHQLKVLILRNNHFRYVPATIRYCKKLKVLDIQNSAKKLVFQWQISQLQQLEELYLNNCKMKNIPKGLEKCEKLRVLRLEKNKLKKILGDACVHKLKNGKHIFQPRTVQNLKNLEVLRIDNNRVSRLSDLSIMQVSSKVLPSLAIMESIAHYSGSPQQQQIYHLRHLTENRLKKEDADYIENELQRFISFSEEQRKIANIIIQNARNSAFLDRIKSKKSIIQKMLNNNIFDRKCLLNLMGEMQWQQRQSLQILEVRNTANNAIIAEFNLRANRKQ